MRYCPRFPRTSNCTASSAAPRFILVRQFNRGDFPQEGQGNSRNRRGTFQRAAIVSERKVEG